MRILFKIFAIIFISCKANAEVIKKIEIEGNNRISDSNVILFGNINIDED